MSFGRLLGTFRADKSVRCTNRKRFEYSYLKPFQIPAAGCHGNLIAIVHLRVVELTISIIITLCLGSIWCSQDIRDVESPGVQDDHWLLLSGIGENDCKGDENDWIKPSVIGYLVGLLTGAVFGVALCAAFIYHCILKNLKFL
ncbi:hypothetical protein LOAG_01576 [Loa loa]|uniref:Uncharacterized protein n=1 Tax=Loa loa TaxID=7209 RepID=A0A1S0U8J6_LOALO|nr:hypothetical protein LOAG_01576 [Loa loa]EFO26901.1 hypothetical protein LOAG_01576 [Loa loa]